MNTVYEPKGRAREYSPLALNVYLTCTHDCKYCYCQQLRGKGFFACGKKPQPRPGIVEALNRDLEKNLYTEQVLLSFVGDVYCDAADGNAATREVLKALSARRVPAAVLTKGGERCLKDVDVFKSFGEHFQIGTTLTFDNDKDSLAMESGAALPAERLSTLKTLHDEGIRTFASFEPVIDPEQSLNLMRKSLDFVDIYKVGKINRFKGLDKTIDWTDFLSRAVDILRDAGKPFYVKQDLRQAAPSVKLFGSEVMADDMNVH